MLVGKEERAPTLEYNLSILHVHRPTINVHKAQPSSAAAALSTVVKVTPIRRTLLCSVGMGLWP